MGSSLEEFWAPQSLRQIGNGAFMSCKCLQRVVLNDGLEVLGTGDSSNVFWGSGIEELVFPGTVKQLSGSAFSECAQLKRIWTEEGSEVDFRSCVGPSVQVLAISRLCTVAGGKRI